MKNLNKQKISVMVAVLGLVLLTAGVTVAFFTYVKDGTTENAVTTDSITFLYEEKDKQGHGIGITDAIPVEDSIGKQGQAFNFEITSNTSNKISIPYEIAVKKTDNSDNLDSVVKLYLTKVDGSGNEEEIALGTYSSFTTKTYYGTQQKLLTQQKVPQSSHQYLQKYRLRMWIDEDTDFSDGTYNNKTFSVTVNVYSQGKVVTPEDIANVNNAGVLQVFLDGTEIQPVETNGTHYEETLPVGTRNAELVIKPANKYSKVEIGKTDSTYQTLIAMNNKTGIVPVTSSPTMTTNAHIKLADGDNYFKGVITAEDGVTTQTLTFKLTVPQGQAAANRLSAMILADNTVVSSGDGLYQSTATDSGDPTYYFYGPVTNNKVRYAGYDWLVVRINDDGTTRLLLADKMDNTSYAINNLYQYWSNDNNYDFLDYMYYSYGEVPNDLVDGNKPILKDALESWYTTNIASNQNYSKWIADKSGNYFCEAYHAQGRREGGDPLPLEVDAYVNSYEDYTFACDTDIYGHRYVDSNIGLLSYDEALFAGAQLSSNAGIYGGHNKTYFDADYTWWLGSPAGYDPYFGELRHILIVESFEPDDPEYNPLVTDESSNGGWSYNIYARPVVNLKAATTATRGANGVYIVD